MARDNSPKIRQRAHLARKHNQRASYDRVLIVSEGSKTEPLYFKEIKNTYRLRTANVEIHPCALGTEPIQVVRYAQQLFERGDVHKRIRAKGVEKIFAVFDRDDHQYYFDALKISESLDQKLRNDANQRVAFRAIASVPCFELWLLLHFEDVHHLLHCNEILRRLKQHMPGYSKGAGQSFAATKQCLNLATQRAKNLNTLLSSTFDDTMPSTAIVELVTLLVELEN